MDIQKPQLSLLRCALIAGASLIVSNAYAAGKPSIPVDGKRLFILGQDQVSIEQYMADPSLPRPHGFTMYTTLTRGATEDVTNYCFKGLDGLKNLDNYNSNQAQGCADSERRNQWGSGVQNAQWVIENYQPEVVALGMFCPGNAQAPSLYNDGAYDDLLIELADFFKLHNETGFFLRTCYEFNGDAHGLSFEHFRGIFKHVRSFLDAQGVTNVAHVWQSDAYHGTGRPSNQALGNTEQGYWPGKQYVDWVGVSQFNSDINEEAEIAEIEGLPLFIAEVTPHGDLGVQYDYKLPFNSSQQVAQGSANPVTIVNNLDWFTEKNAEIMRTVNKAWHYINADWTAQPQWESAADQAGANFFKYTDSRVQQNPEIKLHFIDLVSSENGFILAGEQNNGPVFSNCSAQPSSPINQGQDLNYSCTIVDSPEGVSLVDLNINGIAYPSQNLGNSVYNWTIAASNLQAGSNNLTITAVDAAGSSSNHSVNLEVISANTQVAIQASGNIEIVRGQSTEVTVSASDSDGIASVSLLVNGQSQANLVATTAPYVFTLASQVDGNDVSSIQALATDITGETTLSEVVNVVIKDVPVAEPKPAFGISYIDDTTMRVYHLDEGWTATWNYLCINGDCRPATLENGEYYREVSATLGQSYDIEFKVQDAVLSQYIVSDTAVFEQGTGGGETPPSNQPPTVSVSAPNGSLNEGDDVTITATANDSDGSINSVNFYLTAPGANEQLLASDNAAPYQTNITNLSAGTYQLRVVASDNQAVTASDSTSFSVNTSEQPEEPTEEFGISYIDDNTMRVYHVDQGWTADWNYLCINGDCRSANLDSGIYYRDVSGALGQSYDLEFKVQDNSLSQFIVERKGVVFLAGNTPPSNQAPSVSLSTSPTNTVLAGETLALSATAEDSDGSITSLRFYAAAPNATESLIAEINSAPYTTTISNVIAGVYQLRVEASDNDGATAEDSATIEVQAGSQPSINLSGPATIKQGEDWIITPSLSNWPIAEGEQHFHLVIDGEDLGPQYSSAAITISDLAVGSHTAVAKLANADHSFTGVEASLSVNVEAFINDTVTLVNDPVLGNYLSAGSDASQPGLTLYTFDVDNAGASQCNGNCATTWPPFIVNSASEIKAPSGVSGLGVSARQDGSLQLTLNNEPLYYFSGDNNLGDTSGHGINSVWWVADLPSASFADNTWQKSVVPACADMYSGGSIPIYGYHIYTQNNQVIFQAGSELASKVWGSNARTVFFRNNSEGRLKLLGSVEATRNGDSAAMTVPSDWLTGNSVYYVSFERLVTPLENELGDALAYHDSALYGLNKGCVNGAYTGESEDFAGWLRFQHPQGFFNDHNVFNERIDPVNQSAGHFKNVPRFTISLLQDEPGKDLLFQVDLTYESYSTLDSTIDITWSGIEGSEERAGGGSPRHSLSNQCAPSDASGNIAICNLGQGLSYGQNIDWELRVIPKDSADFNLYTQMLYYVKGHGWAKESSDPRALLGGEASIDAFGANEFERAAAFMQHEHTSSLKVVRDFVEQHEDLRVNIGDDVNPGFNTCESCHINDGRSQVIFDVPNVGPRIAPPLIGLGLLEQVNFAGKAGFGWEGNRATIEDSVRFALTTDFGVSNPDATMVERLTNYSQFVGVPQRDKSLLFDADVLAGEDLFNNAMQCSGCHTETQITAKGDVIRPYSDLLTHDLGDGLFRTTPLWGLGRTADVAAFSMDMIVNGQKNAAHAVAQRESRPADESTVLFMHDGRAKGLDAAVRAHNGEASAAREAFETATPAEQEQLLKFLRSL
ncbi:family 31 carbohydrate-binding protein [Agarivorans albus]|uniref:Cytochrome c domain-containing protein n=1 Tax=Agarivorans albus MKT 106 TaxID=1331007 RepID=R9PPX5_AGAAL|nr:family 31 carbohydrate-binding protein [Agarivorans albus]GAD00186.1 hypothetical protein AALB_0266 [Agarivorans albus MKT 106]